MHNQIMMRKHVPQLLANFIFRSIECGSYEGFDCQRFQPGYYFCIPWIFYNWHTTDVRILQVSLWLFKETKWNHKAPKSRSMGTGRWLSSKSGCMLMYIGFPEPCTCIVCIWLKRTQTIASFFSGQRLSFALRNDFAYVSISWCRRHQMQRS